VRRLLNYFHTALRLGIANVARVLVYRIGKRIGVYRFLLPQLEAVPLGLKASTRRELPGPLMSSADRSVLTEADELLAGKARYFSVHVHNIGNPPDWFLNPFQNARHPQPAVHWSSIADFDAEAGDIKVIWEMSRFAWATTFARAWRLSGNERYIVALHHWMEDWWSRNPPNTGPNWMCGQETSIRLINALLALRLAGLGEENDVAPGLVAFVEAHCRRIDLTTSYAIAQDNNHSTSEAAGLFVGGTWLTSHCEGDAKYRGQRWARKGRKLLDGRVRRLVLPDGSFAQHSLTYHRLLLDTLSIVEAWRRCRQSAPFSLSFYARAAAATRWLGALIEPNNGDGPNLGANDGAHPFRLDSSVYRDFRPCLQLASMTFMHRGALRPGAWDEPAAWLGVPAEGLEPPWIDDLSSAAFPDGGYVVLRHGTALQAVLRAPTAQFRPSHADALHLDLWWRGTNLLRDGGTFSYADTGPVAEALASVAGHNTLQFDDHDQMPRLGRFLYGRWAKVVGDTTVGANAEGQSWTGGYVDGWSVHHRRSVTLGADVLSVLDHVQGFKNKAVLRWRLAPGNWLPTEEGCISSMGRIRIESSVPIRRMSLTGGWESRHYLEKSALPVLEVEIDQSPAVLKTTIAVS
jgi:hypothetical protein